MVIVTAAASPWAGKCQRVIDDSGAVSLEISGGHWWFDEQASTLVGCPGFKALNTADADRMIAAARAAGRSAC